MMPEIRFRYSEERLAEEMEALKHFHGCQWSKHCDECKRWGQGFHEVSTGKFICLNCIARKKWLEMVGKPSEY